MSVEVGVAPVTAALLVTLLLRSIPPFPTWKVAPPRLGKRKALAAGRGYGYSSNR